ncbi:hypothetical protein KTN00_12055 [Acinetobacter soli]|uniref:hypothetical protein n=1 Tax=Acinetobacter soli TaxID=487316 RepID=UPI001C453F70|nr:hypothetical protein [Acinetobacter soli]MBV6551748.1 hypothetical protein [Acinetobacter soli]
MNIQVNNFASDTLPAHLVFEAISKGLKVLVSEVNSNDWTPLNAESNITLRDFYSGFLVFKIDKSINEYENFHYRNKGSQFFYEYLNDDHNGNHRIRCGFDNPTIYILVVRKSRHNDGRLLDKFDIYKESTIGTLPDYCINRHGLSDKLLTGLNRAYQAKQSFEHNQVLSKTGFFGSEDYKNFRRHNKNNGR